MGRSRYSGALAKERCRFTRSWLMWRDCPGCPYNITTAARCALLYRRVKYSHHWYTVLWIIISIIREHRVSEFRIRTRNREGFPIFRTCFLPIRNTTMPNVSTCMRTRSSSTSFLRALRTEPAGYECSTSSLKLLAVESPRTRCAPCGSLKLHRTASVTCEHY